MIFAVPSAIQKPFLVWINGPLAQILAEANVSSRPMML